MMWQLTVYVVGCWLLMYLIAAILAAVLSLVSGVQGWWQRRRAARRSRPAIGIGEAGMRLLLGFAIAAVLAYVVGPML